MTKTRIGFNANSHALGGDGLSRILNYIGNSNPTTMLFMDGFQNALMAYSVQKRLYPDTEPVIIYRAWRTLGNDKWWDTVSTKQWLDAANQTWGQSDKHIWVYLMNEPHVSGEGDVRAFSKKLAEGIDMLCGAGYRVVAGNFSAGTVDHPEWMEDYLRMAAKWGAEGRLLLTEHMYSSPTIPAGYVRRRGSGEVGGVYMPIEESLVPEHLHPSQWLTRQQVQDAFDGKGDAHGGQNTLWHYGRISRFYRYARDVMNIELPGFIATEGLLDAMPDLQFHSGAPRTFKLDGRGYPSESGSGGTVYDHVRRIHGEPPGHISEIKGDVSYRNVFESMYGVPFEQALFMMLSWFDRTAPKELIGVTLFTASYAPDWTRYGHNYFEVPGTWSLLVQEAKRRASDWVGGQDYAPEDSVFLSFEGVPIEKEQNDSVDEDNNDDDGGVEVVNPQWTRWVVTSTASSYVNVRQDHAVGSPIIGRVEVGDDLEIDLATEYTDPYYLWKRVRTSDGTVGWAATLFNVTSYSPPDMNDPEIADLKQKIAELEAKVGSLQSVISGHAQMMGRIHVDAINAVATAEQSISGSLQTLAEEINDAFS